MKIHAETDIFEAVNECRHMLCLLFREYGMVVRIFDRKSAFHKRFTRLKHKVGIALFKYSEVHDGLIRKKTAKSWWLSESYMPLQLELEMHDDAHSLNVYNEALRSLLKEIYENLDRSLNELDRRGIQIFGKTGRVARDTVRHEVYKFLEHNSMKPKTSRAWEIHDWLVLPGNKS